ncbi:50S ribosomal subunit L7/L12 [Candidatus Hodgkinia cicadicola]|nr:50S ribosomal subunit L7/L12 [Candidatus Hodgkinia cicadicola]
MSRIDDIVRRLCARRNSALAESSLLLEAKWGEKVVQLRLAYRNLRLNAKAKAVRNVALIKSGQSEIAVVKGIRSLLSLGLKEAKEFVDSAPKLIKRGLDKPEAAALKAKFEALGAEVELR